MANKYFTISEEELAAGLIKRYGEQEYKKFRHACAMADSYFSSVSSTHDTNWTKLRFMVAYIAGAMDMDAIDDFLSDLGDYQEDYRGKVVNAYTVFMDLGLACLCW